MAKHFLSIENLTQRFPDGQGGTVRLPGPLFLRHDAPGAGT